MNTEIVFGTCDYAAPDGSHSFFRAEGHLDSRGEFAWLPHHITRHMFPDHGTFRVLKPSSKGRYGMFRVVEERRNAAGANGFRFRASPIESTVYQVWSIAEPSSDTEAVAIKLNNGIQIAADVGPFMSILVLFADNVLCGPVRLRPVAGKTDTFKIDPQSLTRPCDAWKGVGGVELRKINVRTHGDMIFAIKPLGEPTTFIDFAPVELALKKILEHVRQIEGTAIKLTPAEIQDLSASLSKIAPSVELKARVIALSHRLKTLDAATSDFAQLIQKCLALPIVRQEIAQEATKAKQAAVANLVTEQAGVVEALRKKQTELDTLSSEVTSLSKRKLELSSELDRIEAATSQSKEKFVEAIAEEARKAERDVTGFLARIASLRPFLSKNETTPPSVSPRADCLKVERLLREAKPISTVESGVKHLTNTLKRFGLDADISATVSVEVIAALVLGQGVAFRGSLATFATAIVSQSVSGACLAHVEVPVGTRLQLDLQNCLKEDSKENQTLGIVLNGANCSCLDAYGGLLTERIRLRITGVLPRATPPHVFFCLREGPSTLLPTVQMAELAPIFHTDTWKWTLQPDAPSLEVSQLRLAQSTLQSSGGDFYDELRSNLKDLPSAVLLAQIRILIPLLTKLHNVIHPSSDVARDKAARSLLNSWVLPFLVAHKAKRETIQACVDLAGSDQLLQQHLNLLTASTEC